MTSKIKVNILADGGDNSIITSDGAGAVTFGTSGNSITIPSGVTITNNGTQTGFGGENTPYFVATSATSVTVPYATTTTIKFDTIDYDSGNFFDTTNFKFYPTVAGYYYLFCNLNNSSGGISAGEYQATFFSFTAESGSLSGVRHPQYSVNEFTQNSTTTINTIAYLNGSTSVKVQTYNSASNLVYGGDSQRTRFGGYKLIGA